MNVVLLYMALFPPGNKHNTIFFFDEPKIIIKFVIQFQAVVRIWIIINARLVKIAIAKGIAVPVVPFSYVALVPVFIIRLRIKVGRWLGGQPGLKTGIHYDKFIFCGICRCFAVLFFQLNLLVRDICFFCGFARSGRNCDQPPGKKQWQQVRKKLK